jgi:hypothetical protein
VAVVAGQVWESIDIRAALVVTVAAFAAAGLLPLLYRVPRAAV